MALVPAQGDTGSANATATPADQATAEAWRDYGEAEKVGTKGAWDAFLVAHPTGFYTDLARSQLMKIAVVAPTGAPGIQSPTRWSDTEGDGQEAEKHLATCVLSGLLCWRTVIGGVGPETAMPSQYAANLRREEHVLYLASAELPNSVQRPHTLGGGVNGLSRQASMIAKRRRAPLRSIRSSTPLVPLRIGVVSPASSSSLAEAGASTLTR